MSLTDKTGVPVTVVKRVGDFAIGVEGKTVGLTAFAERDGQRIFYHTEVDEAFGGRAVCPTVAAYVSKHSEFDDVVDQPTREILDWLRR